MWVTAMVLLPNQLVVVDNLGDEQNPVLRLATVLRCPESVYFQCVAPNRSLFLLTKDMRPAMRNIVIPLVLRMRSRKGRMNGCHRGVRLLNHPAPHAREFIVSGK